MITKVPLMNCSISSLPWHQLVPRKLSDSKDRGRKSLRFVYTRHWWLSSRERSLSRSTRTLWHRRPSLFMRVWKKKRKHYEMHCERDTVTENLASTSLWISHRHHRKSRVGITQNLASASLRISCRYHWDVHSNFSTWFHKEFVATSLLIR